MVPCLVVGLEQAAISTCTEHEHVMVHYLHVCTSACTCMYACYVHVPSQKPYKVNTDICTRVLEICILGVYISLPEFEWEINGWIDKVVPLHKIDMYIHVGASNIHTHT